jgi:signal transduction histidine kinase
MRDAARETHEYGAATFSTARRRLRRVRWIWLLAGMVIYAAWDAVDQQILTPLDPILGGFGIDWGVIAVIGVALMLIVSDWEDRQLARLEELTNRNAAADRRAAQLEAAQATARAVAHNLNQPLAVIRGYTELLIEAPSGERSETDLAHILTATDRAAVIVRQLVQLNLYETIPYAGGAPMVDLGRTGEAGS